MVSLYLSRTNTKSSRRRTRQKQFILKDLLYSLAEFTNGCYYYYTEHKLYTFHKKILKKFHKFRRYASSITIGAQRPKDILETQRYDIRGNCIARGIL